MEDKIKNFNELINHIKGCRKKNLENIKNSGGINLYCRALIAQLLWLTLIYNIGTLLIPAKQFLLSLPNIIILVIIYRIIGSKIPSAVDNFFKGNFFHKFDINFLNWWILSLIVIISGITFIKIHLNNFIRPYGNKE